MRRWHVIVTLLAAVACESPADQWDAFALAQAAPGHEVLAFEPTSAFRLDRIMTIGGAIAPDEQLFGSVGGASFAADGSILVTDRQERRVAQYDASGKLIRYFGQQGSGPGEFLSPGRISAYESEIAVFDEALGRVTVFDSSGTYLRSIPVPEGPMISDMRVPTPGVVAVTLSLQAGPPLLLVDSVSRHTVTGLGDFPSGGKLLPRNAHPGGALCISGSGQLVYANPWVYQLLGLGSDGAVAWSRRIRSELVVPAWITQEADGQAEAASGLRQNVGLMGLACDQQYIVLAYLDMADREIFYDILGPSAEPRAHLRYPLVDDLDQPGYLVDMRGDTLLTYRGTPYPHVSLFRVIAEGP